MAKSRTLRIALNIPAYEIQQYYEGVASNVAATAADGRTVRFPASTLRSVVTREGVYGEFELAFDEHNKFLSIRRIGD